MPDLDPGDQSPSVIRSSRRTERSSRSERRSINSARTTSGRMVALQPFLDDKDANPKTGEQRLKQIEVSKGTDAAYELAK